MTDQVNILLVDDQPSRLLSYEVILKDIGANLVRAYSGEEALRCLMQQEFAVILLDVNMPGIDGFETASLIHQHPRYEKTPIIFVTGVHVTDMDRLRGYKLGAFDYVYIPVVPEILRSKVSMLVELYVQRREVTRLSDAKISQLNAALERRVEELEALIELSPVGIAIGEDGELSQVRVNRALRELLKIEHLLPNEPVSYDAMPGYRVLENGETMKRENLPMEVCVRTGVAVDNVELDIELNDGSRIVVMNSVRPLFDGDGNVRGCISVSTDITDRKRMEDALRESDRRKDEFLAILGHELRNPLAPIRNAAQIMRVKGIADPQLAWLRDVIERQVEHLTRLVDDLLDVSRITRGKIELKRETLALADVVGRAIESSRPLIDERKHDLVVKLSEEPLRVNGDVTRLSQVLGNLLNNAAKYTPEGGRIELDVSRVGNDARIRVHDTGIGIPDAMLARIFEPFTQVETTREHAQGGLGIGLALVARLVEMHGGRVEAHSEGKGQGSEFTLWLPLVHAEPRRIDDEAGEPAKGAARRILVADDNHDAAVSLATMLRLEGHEVMVANDGYEAVSIAHTFRPDAALLDIGMPRMDGYDAARRIRETPWGKAMLIVALSGWGQQEDRRRTLEAGFDAHRVKPVEPSDLLNLLAGTVAVTA